MPSERDAGVVVGVDRSPEADEALRWAASEARAHGTHLAAVMAWTTGDDGADAEPIRTSGQAERLLDEQVRSVLGSEGDGVRRLTVRDTPIRALTHLSGEASLLVIGARSIGALRSLILGSTSREVLRQATAPVAIVRGGAAGRFATTGRVTVGVDGSPASVRALEWSLREAHVRGASLTVLHAWTGGGGVYPFVGDEYDAELARRSAQTLLDRALSGLDEPTGLTIDRVAVEGRAAETLVALTRESDVVVVGARGLGGVAGMVLGSVSQRVVRDAVCPVVVTR